MLSTSIDSISINITTYGAQNEALPTNVSVKLDNQEFITNNLKPCRDNTLNIIAFNRFTGVPYPAVPYIYQDARTCGRLPQIINSFTVNQRESGTGDFVDAIDKVVTGDTVVIFTIGDVRYSEWTSVVWDKLLEIGAEQQQLSSLLDGDPFVLVGKKGGEPGTAVVYKSTSATPAEGVLEFGDLFYGIEVGGTFITPEIYFTGRGKPIPQ